MIFSKEHSDLSLSSPDNSVGNDKGYQFRYLEFEPILDNFILSDD